MFPSDRILGAGIALVIALCGPVVAQDADGDGVGDPCDNCPMEGNSDQYDRDSDGLGNACDDDVDGDGILNDADNCRWIANKGQENADEDGVGDACEAPPPTYNLVFEPLTPDTVASGAPVAFSVRLETQSLSCFNAVDLILGSDMAPIAFEYGPEAIDSFENLSPPGPFGLYKYDLLVGGITLYSVVNCHQTLDLGILRVETNELQDGVYEILVDPKRDSGLSNLFQFLPGTSYAEPLAGHTSFSVRACARDDDCALGETCLLGVCNFMGVGAAICDDGVFCNGSELCDEVVGCASPPPRCDDGEPCTVDSCNEEQQTCTNTPRTGDCNDGLFCNGMDQCVDGACVFHEGDPCVGGGDCSNVCDETRDTCSLPAGTPCVDDGISCTENICDGAGECTAVPVDSPCSDGLYCNGVEVCDTALGCVPGSPPCRAPWCDEDTDTCITDPIPAVSTWGIVALALALAAMGKAVSLRNRTNATAGNPG